jgi:5-methylcytosine-specific restriction endonuclease McrA
MLVYVRNQDGAPLMPCTPAKARKLLRVGTARVVAHTPFTIQLAWQCEGHVQEEVVGIDKGSSVTGLSCVGNGVVLLAAEIHHRRDVKEKLDTRRAHRRDRRSRKWYRPPRFLNRASSKRSGRLPPSIKTNVDEVIRVVRQFPLPISQIVVEDVQVDIARLNNPALRGSQYQDPARLDENLRIACLMRDRYTCRHCGRRKCRLEAHHIVYRERGGKDTLANLLTLCESCHGKVHQGKITLATIGISGHLDQIAQRSMQGKTHLYATLGASVPLTTVFGYETAAFRKHCNLAKAHTTDALCVATLGSGEMVAPDCPNTYTISFRPRQTRRQFHDLPRKGLGRVRYQVNEELAGFRKGDIVRVKGRWVKHVNSIYSSTAKMSGRLAFARVKDEPPSALPQDCLLLSRGRTVRWEHIQ